MSATPVSPFVLVGDPSAAACEGDFCPAPEVREQVVTREDQERDLSPVERAHVEAGSGVA